MSLRRCSFRLCGLVHQVASAAWLAPSALSNGSLLQQMGGTQQGLVSHHEQPWAGLGFTVRFMGRKSAHQVRSGDVLIRDGRLLKVLKFQMEHGRARASGFIALDCVEVGAGGSGGRSQLKLRPDEGLETADLASRSLQVLYTEGAAPGGAPETVHLLDQETFEQVSVSDAASVFGAPAKWLMPELDVEVKFLGDAAVLGSIPPKVKVKVVEARPAVTREDGSNNRHVVVEGGANVLVPGHIDVNDVIVVNTAEGTYVSKA